MSDNCPVCKTALNGKKPTRNPACSTYDYDCPRCGKFLFTFPESDLDLMEAHDYCHDKDWRSVLSHHIRKMQKDNSGILLNGDLVKAILKKIPPSLNEQIDNIIRWLGRTTKPGELLVSYK